MPGITEMSVVRYPSFLFVTGIETAIPKMLELELQSAGSGSNS